MFHYTGRHDCRITLGPRGGWTESIYRVRRNGRTQTWVTRPTHFRLPVKYGYRARDQFSIWYYDADMYHPESRCPVTNSIRALVHELAAEAAALGAED
jgi:hypothetical protein